MLRATFRSTVLELVDITVFAFGVCTTVLLLFTMFRRRRALRVSRIQARNNNWIRLRLRNTTSYVTSYSSTFYGSSIEC